MTDIAKDRIHGQTEAIAKALFTGSSAQVLGLFELTQQVISDAVDIRVVLTSNVQGARNARTEAQMAEVATVYDTACNRTAACAAGIGGLIRAMQGARYGERIKGLLPQSEDGLSDEQLHEAAIAAARLQVGMTGRYMDWTLLLIGLAHLINGFDRAHRILIRRQTLGDRLKSLVKPAAVELMAQKVPVLGAMITLGEAAQPDLSRLLNRMETSVGTMDQINAFAEVCEELLRVARMTADAIVVAESNERQFESLLIEAEA